MYYFRYNFYHNLQLPLFCCSSVLLFFIIIITTSESFIFYFIFLTFYLLYFLNFYFCTYHCYFYKILLANKKYWLFQSLFKLKKSIYVARVLKQDSNSIPMRYISSIANFFNWELICFCYFLWIVVNRQVIILFCPAKTNLLLMICPTISISTMKYTKHSNKLAS